MMLSSTLPHCSWELASYCGSTMRHICCMSDMSEVASSLIWYLLLSVILPAFVPWWIWETFSVLTPDWCYMMWRLNSSQGSQKDLQANWTHKLGICRSCLCICVCVCVSMCVLRVDRYGGLRGSPSTNVFRRKSQYIMLLFNWNIMNKYTTFYSKCCWQDGGFFKKSSHTVTYR